MGAGLKLLFAALPGLAWGPLGWFVTWVVMKFADQLYAVAKDAATMIEIRLVNDAHQSAFDSASLKLKIIAHEFGENSEEFKNAREATKKALHDLVGARP